MKLGILKADTLSVYSSSGGTPYSALQSGIYLSLANFYNIQKYTHVLKIVFGSIRLIVSIESCLFVEQQVLILLKLKL